MKTVLAEAARVPLARQIEDIVLSTPVVDVHTHLLCNPAFKEAAALGIDGCWIYHYLSRIVRATWILPLRDSSGRSRRPQQAGD